MPTVEDFSFQKWYEKLESCFLNDSRSPRVTRDELVWGPDGLIYKTTIALLHREITLNSCSARHSPKPAISQTPW